MVVTLFEFGLKRGVGAETLSESLLFSQLMSLRAFKKTPPKTALQTLAYMRGFCV